MEEHVDDGVYIKRVVEGDAEAYTELVRRYHGRVLALCLSMLMNYSEAEDAAQDAFLKAFGSLPRYTRQASFLTWISRIASNHCLDILRKRKRQKTESLDGLGERGDPEGFPVEATASEEAAIGRREHLALAMQALEVLPPDYRQILILREVEGLRYEEIASVMNCTLESVRARLRRARLALQDHVRHVSKKGASIP